MEEPTSTDAGKRPNFKFFGKSTTVISDPEPDGDRNKSHKTSQETSRRASSLPEERGGTLPDRVAQIDGSGDPASIQIATKLSPGPAHLSTIAERRRTAPPRLVSQATRTEDDELQPLVSETGTGASHLNWTPSTKGLRQSIDSLGNGLRLTSQEVTESPMTP